MFRSIPLSTPRFSSSALSLQAPRDRTSLLFAHFSIELFYSLVCIISCLPGQEALGVALGGSEVHSLPLCRFLILDSTNLVPVVGIQSSTLGFVH